MLKSQPTRELHASEASVSQSNQGYHQLITILWLKDVTMHARFNQVLFQFANRVSTRKYWCVGSCCHDWVKDTTDSIRLSSLFRKLEKDEFLISSEAHQALLIFNGAGCTSVLLEAMRPMLSLAWTVC